MAESHIQTKIAALLRQAEKAGTAAESETYQNKAQQLSIQYGIDMEIARAADIRSTRRPHLVKEQMRIGDRGSRSLQTYIDLFVAIARANNVKVTQAYDRTYVYAHGFDNDVDTTLALYVSLVGQMVKESDAYLRAGEFKTETVYRPATDKWDSRKQEYVYSPAGYYPVHGKTARRSFQEAFAYKVGARLREQRIEAEAAAKARTADHFHTEDDAAIQAATTSDSVALAIQTRREEVELFFKKMNPRLGTARSRSATSSSSHAHYAGTAAGARARISPARQIGGSRTAVSA